jgi:hypothetical protein
LIPHPRDPDQRLNDQRPGEQRQLPSKLTGRGCTDLQRPAGPELAQAHGRATPRAGPRSEDLVHPVAAGLNDPAVPEATPRDGLAVADTARPDGEAVPDDAQGAGGRRRRGRVRGLVPGEAARTPKGGWYAYRAVGAATLPSWAVEVALTVERPVDRHFDGWPAHNGQARAGPPALQRVEPQTIVLLRAPGMAGWLAGIAEAAAEIEAAAGLRHGSGAGGLDGDSTGAGSRLRMGPPMPGLVPVPPAVAQVRLGAAGERGLAAPVRRRRPPSGGGQVSWRAGAGAVLTCGGPSGVSAQAVVALGGAGHLGAIAPPPGGALILPAWRTKGTWAAACGLVLGAVAARGLGREAGHVAATARTAGWDAVVLQRSAALRLARAGDHRHMAPEAAARAASAEQVVALFAARLTAGGVGHTAPAAEPSWALAVTP